MNVFFRLCHHLSRNPSLFLCCSCLVQIGWSSIATECNELLKKINFWVFSVGMKLGPCILLTYLSLTLITALVEADERKTRLANRTQQERPSISSLERGRLSTIAVQNPLIMAKRSSLARPYSDRTNKMLLAVLLLFLVTEFPSGILVLLSGILGERFFLDVYIPLGEVLDILALVNSSINFILYCTTSSVFRQTFCNLFCPFFLLSQDPISLRTGTTATTTSADQRRSSTQTVIHFTKSHDNALDTPL